MISHCKRLPICLAPCCCRHRRRAGYWKSAKRFTKLCGGVPLKSCLAPRVSTSPLTFGVWAWSWPRWPASASRTPFKKRPHRRSAMPWPFSTSWARQRARSSHSYPGGRRNAQSSPGSLGQPMSGAAWVPRALPFWHACWLGHPRSALGQRILATTPSSRLGGSRSTALEHCAIRFTKASVTLGTSAWESWRLRFWSGFERTRH